MQGAVEVNWQVALPALISAMAPTITGFLQQFQKNLSSANWLVKVALNAVIGGLLGTVASYASSGDVLLSSAAGVILGSIGSINIALRRGSRGNLEASLEPKDPGALPTPPTP